MFNHVKCENRNQIVMKIQALQQNQFAYKR